MRRKWFWLAIILLILIGVVSSRLTKPKLTDKEQIEQAITDLKTAVEDKNASGILRFISSDYSDSAGMNYDKIRALSWRLRRNLTERIRVELPNYEEPKIEKDSASVNLSVKITVLSDGNAVLDVQGPVQFTFKKERGGWKILNAEGWQGWTEGLE